MRGKASKLLTDTFSIRITPAYAGKRSADKLRGYMLQDHPRLCGEKDTVSSWSNGVKGSPPPMRGKACFFQLGEVPAGITPAYAGKRNSLFHSPEVE